MADITGKVVRIRTNRDGSKEVRVERGSRAETFKHPGELTDEQLAELERAQENNFDVTVWWETDGEKKRVTAVDVYSYSRGAKTSKTAGKATKARRR